MKSGPPSPPLTLARTPALRILIPFVGGIILSDAIPGLLPIILTALLGITMLMVMHHRGRNPLRQFHMRQRWILPLSLLVLAAGALALQLYRPLPLDIDRIAGKTLMGRVESVDAFDSSMRLQVQLTQVGNDAITPRRILLTTRGCDYLLHEGDQIAFAANLAPITNLGNPDQFDRQSLQWQRGILYDQHINIEQLARVGHSSTPTSVAASARRQLIARVLDTSLSQHTQDFVIALLLGNGSLLDNRVREQFSAAGIAHILALSGLHVGIIASLIWFLFFPLDYLRLKKLRLIVTLLALAAFAWLTGLSPSVLRATIMIGFTLTAIVLYRKSLALNAMCIAALLTLCLWPTAIFQAGFQLSYVTVGAIVGLHGVLPDLVNRKRRFLYGAWSLVSTSLIALLATIMLSAYYFCSISLLSVLSNVLILPIMPLVMLLGVIFLFLAALGLEWNVVNTCLDAVYYLINKVSEYVSFIPGSHFSGVYVTGTTVWLFYGMLACLVVWFVTRRGRWLLMALTMALATTVQLCYVKLSTPQATVIILNDYRSTPIIWHENGQSYAWIPDARDTDHELFERNHRRLLAHLGSDSLCWVTDSARSTLSVVKAPFAMLQGQRIMLADKGSSSELASHLGDKDEVDVLIVTKRFHGSISDILNQGKCQVVVLSGALPKEMSDALTHECQQRGITCHDLHQHGAWQQLPLN